MLINWSLIRTFNNNNENVVVVMIKSITPRIGTIIIFIIVMINYSNYYHY